MNHRNIEFTESFAKSFLDLAQIDLTQHKTIEDRTASSLKPLCSSVSLW